MGVITSQHKQVPTSQFCVDNTDPSGQNWSNILCRDDMSPTCWQHFQLREKLPAHVSMVRGKEGETITDCIWEDAMALFESCKSTVQKHGHKCDLQYS
jgi:hypothetical protein